METILPALELHREDTRRDAKKKRKNPRNP
jgi:hypothetical protein